MSREFIGGAIGGTVSGAAVSGLMRIRMPMIPKADMTKPVDVLVYRVGDGARAVDKYGNIIAESTDHADVIQKAIDNVAAQGGGTVLLSSGSYRLGYNKLVLLRSNVSLIGAGANSTILEQEGGKFGSNLQVVAGYYGMPGLVENVHIAGLKIVPVGAAKDAEETGGYPVAGILVNAATGSLVRNVLIEDILMEGDRTTMVTGEWARYDGVNDSLLVVKDVVIRNVRIIHTGAAKYPTRLFQPHDFERMWVIDCYFRGRDYANVPLDPAKPGGIHASGKKLYMFNVVVDGAHHNNFENGHLREVMIVGSEMRESDDCFDLNDAKKVVIVGCKCINSGTFVSPEINSEDIVAVGNYIEGSNFLSGSNSRRIVMANNVGRVAKAFEDYGGFEDVIIEGNHLEVSGFLYWFVGSPDAPQSKNIKIINNRFRLLSGADYRVMVGPAANNKVVNVEFAYNEVWGPGPANAIDIIFYPGSYVGGVKYYTFRHVFIHDNIFRNCRYVSVVTVSDHADWYVWHNVNMGYLDGGTSQIRWNFLDTGAYGTIAQDAIRMVATFDASIAGAQTKTASNFVSLMPKRAESFYYAQATIRSAPSGWAGYVMAKPNPTNPESKVDVTLVTTTTATGTVEVEVILGEAYPQGYGYNEPGTPVWRR